MISLFRFVDSVIQIPIFEFPVKIGNLWNFLLLKAVELKVNIIIWIVVVGGKGNLLKFRLRVVHKS